MNWESRTVSLLLCLSILLATIHNGNAERKIVCYYTNWSIYRPGTAKFSPQNINPYLCTHLIYAFGGFTKDNALKPFDKYQDIEKGGYAKFTGLKTYNKNLKTLLAVGGWNEGSSRFSPMVADPGRRREFVKNAVKFLRKNHFDGLDLDWEYPAFRDGGKPRDKDNYASLVQELREEFEREASKTGRPRLLLTMAMPAGVEYIDKGYDVPRLNEHLDFINLLSYDYHSSYEPAVDHHSPLYPLEEDNEYNYDAELTIDYTVKYLSKKGAAPEKIVLGIPTYGRSYTLFNEDATDLGSPADGPGVEGEATREKGYLAYYEICEGLAQSDEWEVIQPNPKAMGPYAYKGDQWVGYDDESIVRLKARYVNEKNLGGIMFWTIDNDDFRGRCHGRPYPLIEAAKEALLTDSSNIIQRSKTTVDNRKKPRVHGVQGDTAGRKSFRRGSGKSTTTAAPPPRTRVFSPRPSYRTFSRPKASEEEKEEERSVDRRSYDSTSSVDEEGSSEGGNAVRAASKNGRPGSKSKRRPSKDRSSRNRTKQIGNNDSSEGSLSNRLTTPEPPTTPDPGTDFKCEDEGFFPHPRDCKKYFWCLESGPGGLGVIAHQFTCPSGLVFNKAADSCDYPRNVICPKSKTSQSAASTPRAPIVAATSRTTFLYSTTRRPPSTEKPDTEEEEYEYYDDEDDEQTEEEEAKEKEEKEEREATSTTPKALLYKTISRSRPTTSTTTTEAPFERNEPDKLSDVEENEEDPKVIKELIMLIKKAGGIEQLEKQLLLQDKNPENESGAKSGNENATPATISRSLYERVLSRQAGKITSRQRANGPGSAQFEGLDELPEVKGLRRSQKPQYVTIERAKSPTKESPTEDEQDDEEEHVDENNTDVASSEEQTISNPFVVDSTLQRATPSYVSIRRARPSISSRNENDVEEKVKDTEGDAPVSSQRRRPGSVFPKSSESSSSEGIVDQESRSPASEQNPQTTKSRYVSVQRFRSTTPYSTEVAPVSQEPITKKSIVSRSEEEEEEEVQKSRNDENVTTTSTTIATSLVTNIVSSTPNDIVIDSETEKPIPTTTPEASSTTVAESTVKLVEDSATEILLTTVPASLPATSSAPSARIGTASVSQPRPFGFNRRNRPSAESTTTPLPPSTDQVRPKVSISSRNQTRSTSPAGSRDRPRPITERSRNRGTSRYTPPTFRVRSEVPSDAVISRELVRTTEPTVGTTASAARRRLRRPSSKTIKESRNVANELEDSPIVRIVQAQPGWRRSLSSRSRNTIKVDETDSDRITNIKVFRKPATTNKDQARARYTRKRNNVEIGESEAVEEKTSSTSASKDVVTVTTSKQLMIFNSSLDGSLVDKGSIRTTIPPTELRETTRTTNGPEIEASTQELAVENEVIPVTDDRLDAGQELTTIATLNDDVKLEDFDQNVVKIVFPANNTEAVQLGEESTNAVVPRRRKVLLRRRLVISHGQEKEEEEEEVEEEEENKPIPRRRKVIKRVRPVQSTASTVDLLRSRSTTPAVDPTSTIAVETLDVSTTETIDDFTGVVLETSTPETALADIDIATMASTIVDNVTAVVIESSADTAAATESTMATKFLINFTEANDVSDNVTTSIPTVITPSVYVDSRPSSPRLEIYNRTYYLDSRYVRKKFIRRRPVVSSSSENVTDSRYSNLETSTSAPVINTKNDLTGLSKRRKTLFVRRRPVSFTTENARTMGLVEKEEKKFHDEGETPRDVESATSRIDETLSIERESEAFWSRYIAPSVERSSSTLDEKRATLQGNEEAPEIRSRYRATDPPRESLHSFDSLPEESEEPNDPKSRYQNFRQPRTRYRYRSVTRNREEEAEESVEESIEDATQSSSFDSSAQLRPLRFYGRRPVPSTEPPVTETLIPAKRFDYVADAHRRQQQSLRTTTPRSVHDHSTVVWASFSEQRANNEIRNFVEGDYATTTQPTAQPLVTRLVTSVEESATTERQKILIKTKYSSLTSTTKIPLTTTSSISDQSLAALSVPRRNEEQSANEIRQEQVERSTLPIEGEFLYQPVFTTESHESSTIEIESVFSNLIGNRDSAK
ncbi:mucin-5AC-like isoform X1 [Frieseomelitta varia]|uniref:mucin-5AC-like isoform X1 n=1 Tax=Frieseomelitta varia TaxID=561572 RepID=UPI001CB67CDB|nr:mucin-5AC-like isoform X1 [Frieseomelitta varia]